MKRSESPEPIRAKTHLTPVEQWVLAAGSIGLVGFALWAFASVVDSTFTIFGVFYDAAFGIP